MNKISTIIQDVLKEVDANEVEFDLGIDYKKDNLIVSNLSDNRIKFKVVKLKDG